MLRSYVLCLIVIFVGITTADSGCMNTTEKPIKEIDMQEIIILQSDKGKTFEPHQGDSILIRLEENPTTGYIWEVDVANDQIIYLKDSNFSTANDTVIGGGGIRIFTFTAQSPGTGEVKLELRREWEEKAIDHFGVTIHVIRNMDTT